MEVDTNSCRSEFVSFSCKYSLRDLFKIVVCCFAISTKKKKKKKVRAELAATGISPPHTELDDLLEEIIQKTSSAKKRERMKVRKIL